MTLEEADFLVAKWGLQERQLLVDAVVRALTPRSRASNNGKETPARNGRSNQHRARGKKGAVTTAADADRIVGIWNRREKRQIYEALFRTFLPPPREVTDLERAAEWKETMRRYDTCDQAVSVEEFLASFMAEKATSVK